MTERYQHVIYRIGKVWDVRTGERLPPEEERRILDKMNQRLFASTIEVDKKATK